MKAKYYRSDRPSRLIVSARSTALQRRMLRGRNRLTFGIRAIQSQNLLHHRSRQQESWLYVRGPFALRAFTQALATVAIIVVVNPGAGDSHVAGERVEPLRKQCLEHCTWIADPVGVDLSWVADRQLPEFGQQVLCHAL